MNIITETKQGRNMVDLTSFDFVENRRIFIFEPITDETARRVITEIEYLEHLSPDQDIRVCINSPGGSVSAGLAILDAMHRSSCDICTEGTGLCASMGAMLLACGGTPGKRFASRHCEIMIHQPLGGVSGQSTDMELAVNRIVRTRNLLNAMLATATGKKMDEIALATDRDNFMTADEALNYGLIDEVD